MKGGVWVDNTGMNEIDATKMRAVSAPWKDFVNKLADLLGDVEDAPLPVEQHIYAGVYTRTGCQKAGIVCATALVKVPTQLIVSGHCRIWCEDQVFEVNGYRVLEGMAGRQMIVYTIEDTWATVLFATDAKTPEEAEAEAVGEQVFMRLSNHHLKENTKCLH